MHIPDGYLGPQTYVPMWGVMVLFWAKASSTVRRTLSSANLPLLAIGAAFSFVVMMFNVPIPGGTTGHAVGGALVTILLGPWAAAIAVSVALVIQALIFGDGGITAIAANCFTMAAVGPFVAWWTYRAVAGGSDAMSPRRARAAGIAAYASLNASALATAILFGIQPALAHTASGQPLYAPYPLAVAVPAMMLEHLLLFGLVEGASTALVVRWFQANDPALLRLGTSGGQGVPTGPEAFPDAGALPGLDISPGVGALPAPAAPTRDRYRRLWIGLAVLAILSPLGLWLPAALGGGAAWGEWGSQELRQLLGFVPAGLARLESVWDAAAPGYAVPGLTGPVGEAVGYVLSAAVGILAVAAVAWLLTRLLVPRDGTSSGGTGAPDAG